MPDQGGVLRSRFEFYGISFSGKIDRSREARVALVGGREVTLRETGYTYIERANTDGPATPYTQRIYVVEDRNETTSSFSFPRAFLRSMSAFERHARFY